MKASNRSKEFYARAPVRDRTNMAVVHWFQEKGTVSSERICDLYSIDLEHFSKRIRLEIEHRASIKIPDTTPKVEIVNTQEGLDRQYPIASVYINLGYTLELFYYLANPQIHQRNGNTLR